MLQLCEHLLGLFICHLTLVYAHVNCEAIILLTIAEHAQVSIRLRKELLVLIQSNLKLLVLLLEVSFLLLYLLS